MFDPKINFLNFVPTDGFRLYADNLICRLIDLAPSDAASFSCVEKRGARYMCKIEIISTVQRFETFIEAMNPKTALEEARRRIVRQLNRWGKRRFAALA